MNSTEKDKTCRQAGAQDAEEPQTAGQEKDGAPETNASGKEAEKKSSRRALKCFSLGLLFFFFPVSLSSTRRTFLDFRT